MIFYYSSASGSVSESGSIRIIDFTLRISTPREEGHRPDNRSAASGTIPAQGGAGGAASCVTLGQRMRNICRECHRYDPERNPQIQS